MEKGGGRVSAGGALVCTSSISETYLHLIYFDMIDEAMQRLLDFDRRRYWLANGWSIRFRIAEVEVSTARPHGIKYAFTLHDYDGTRLLGFDNAHGIPRAEAYDHRHRFRRPKQVATYEFRGADELVCDFFAAVEAACKEEEVPFEFEADEIELEAESEEDDDDAKVTD